MAEVALVGRATLLADLRRRLADGGRVTVTGPAGSGRSAVVLAAIGDTQPHWLLHPTEADRHVPYCALADLLLRLDTQSRLDALPAPQRAAVDAVLTRRAGEPDPIALRLALLGLLRTGLLVVDDAHWLDEPSRDVLTYLVRRGGGALGVLATARAGQPPLPGTTELPLPPLDLPDAVRLLQRHGLPAGPAAKIHAAAGGNPGLLLAVGAATAEAEPSAFDTTLTPAVLAVARAQLAALDPGSRGTLLLAVLAERPTAKLLRRAGRVGAARDLAAAEAAGLATTAADGRIGLRAGVLAAVLEHDADSAQLADCHRALAAAARDDGGRLWHTSAVCRVPDAALAHELAHAAVLAHTQGRPARAAELALRAVSLATADIPADRIATWLTDAARAAGAAGRTDLVRAAVSLLDEAPAAPADRARARVAMADAAGQALDGLDDLLARALAEADGDHALVAAVRLRLAWRANLSEGSPRRAAGQARAAARHARLADDGPTEALALTMLARMQRILGEPEAEATLARALDLPDTPPAYGLHNSARYLALRHAFFDDRLGQARAGLLAMLPVAEASGNAEDLVDLLRSLAEVEIRLGRGQSALGRALRALRLSERAGLSPGPSCYTAALAELAGGTAQRARTYAERAVAASAQEHDQVYLARAWHAVGQIELACRDTTAATRALRQVRELDQRQEVRDPSLLRWHGDLAEALTGTGELDAAQLLIAQTRAVAGELRRTGVTAALDRAEGLLRCAAGDGAHAVALLRRSQDRFALLGMPIERGRSLLALAGAERRRRRHAAAREALHLAEETFHAAASPGWAALARDRDQGRRAETGDGPPELTETEARIVALATGGASNREIGATLFLSVKTVEATLTRLYRRTGVRSRAQLHHLLRPGA
ncbi:LuxR family transcriptional regulator [Catellatospora tritici]|uniref:AAA family ATPase n=1 Tax=Catellatospora tritici TaxID=2851566 RepID=UPI001C2D3668|nr:LuxR family transcriptional regulator [Catellatospora tritici]MBV1853701.1 AAA family ATPase [Catellatospora tritici]